MPRTVQRRLILPNRAGWSDLNLIHPHHGDMRKKPPRERNRRLAAPSGRRSGQRRQTLRPPRRQQARRSRRTPKKLPPTPRRTHDPLFTMAISHMRCRPAAQQRKSGAFNPASRLRRRPETSTNPGCPILVAPRLERQGGSPRSPTDCHPERSAADPLASGAGCSPARSRMGPRSETRGWYHQALCAEGQNLQRCSRRGAAKRHDGERAGLQPRVPRPKRKGLQARPIAGCPCKPTLARVGNQKHPRTSGAPSLSLRVWSDRVGKDYFAGNLQSLADKVLFQECASIIDTFSQTPIRGITRNNFTCPHVKVSDIPGADVNPPSGSLIHHAEH